MKHDNEKIEGLLRQRGEHMTEAQIQAQNEELEKLTVATVESIQACEAAVLRFSEIMLVKLKESKG